MSTTNQPAAKLIDGSVQATVWRNEGESGPWYSVKFTRTYRDSEEQLRDADTFSGTDLLKIRRLV